VLELLKLLDRHELAPDFITGETRSTLSAPPFNELQQLAKRIVAVKLSEAPDDFACQINFAKATKSWFSFRVMRSQHLICDHGRRPRQASTALVAVRP
jgi:hypothetical protein